MCPMVMRFLSLRGKHAGCRSPEEQENSFLFSAFSSLGLVCSSVADPERFNADPDPACHAVADPDPIFFS